MPNRRMADAEKTSLHRRPCGIIRVTALCPLCRYRHNGHWTGHASRLGRDLKNRFGTAAYAAEELVAELSSATLGAELGLPVTHLDSHASYIEHWLKLLKDDDRAILTAAAKAEEASTLLLKLGGRGTPEQFDDASDDAALAA
jgi:antirestriction protein ArdC